MPTVSVGDAECLEFADDTFDVDFSNGVLHHTPDILKSLQETYRVLKKGGYFYVILYHRDSLFYWLTLFLSDHILRLGFFQRSFKTRLSIIEFTTSGHLSLVNVYSKKDVSQILQKVGFKVASIHVRKLLRENLPNIPILCRLWPLVPQRFMDKIGKYFGWFLLAVAVKGNHD